MKILDFGLARAVGEEAQLTQQGAIVGTPAYMAPEQAQGKSVDQRCDLFSLGCVLYRMATGETPFTGADMISTLMAVATHNPPAPHELNGALPKALSELIMRLLAKEAGDRSASAQEVAESLDRLSREPVDQPTAVKPKAVSLPPPPLPPISSPVVNRAPVHDVVDLPTTSPPLKRAKSGPTAAVILARQKRGRKWWSAASVLLALGVCVFAATVIKLKVKTPKGEMLIVLEIDQPGAEVFVDGDKISVTVPGGGKSVEIKAEPGLHKLRIRKEGFEVVTREVELKAGKSKPIKVRLDPVKVAARPSATFIAEGLSNWEGLIKEFWTYKDGALVGYTPKAPAVNTFLCSKKKYRDFEMKFKVRLKDGIGNSGVQIRSKIVDAKQFAVAGPQGDIGDGSWGDLYGERFGGMIKAASNNVQHAVKSKGFNDYYIKCVGKHVTIKVNGVTSVDDDFHKMPDEGIIAFQLHADYPSMEVTFKDIEFTELATAKPGATSLPSGPVDAAWWKAVAALPVLEQTDAVAAKLKELNRGFVGPLSPVIEGGVVTELHFKCSNVKNISPLRAFPRLRKLECVEGPLSELWPLKDMRLTFLDCRFTQVSDLSPLKDMKLTGFTCRGSPVSDLSPLKDMKLTHLDCAHTQVSDLSPLKGMPLTKLLCDDTPLSKSVAAEGHEAVGPGMR